MRAGRSPTSALPSTAIYPAGRISRSGQARKALATPRPRFASAASHQSNGRRLGALGVDGIKGEPQAMTPAPANSASIAGALRRSGGRYLVDKSLRDNSSSPVDRAHNPSVMSKQLHPTVPLRKVMAA